MKVKRTEKHKASKTVLGLEHRKMMASLQDSSRNAVKMAFPKPSKVVCVYTDSSEEVWAAIVAQTEETELGRPTQQQQHEPLAFLAGKFNRAQRN